MIHRLSVRFHRHCEWTWWDTFLSGAAVQINTIRASPRVGALTDASSIKSVSAADEQRVPLSLLTQSRR